ncbi:pyridoxal phosphate-dependent aminotransferase [Acidaminobacter hydrogenoformans]|uniref:Aromatic-amino-acid transaminase n=1 Tax=Acidaminobacter hydrogenoformans DSM 2784 TaxID=1120920 RepID=A0A1G5RSB3_9FIRM|nr:aminotransferase class I/II-fold pyridoxal phosphate-dependent enzyme [Acidaminobacter hydrogenoformans]SCZ76159.1 aromatic-amino-acid transaminase [Acidaminobacter hydrogenoformans DSM 2784]
MNSHFSMVAPHSKRPVVPDVIFGTGREAQDAEAKYGFEKVINSTLGVLMDDTGQLVFLPTVMERLRDLPDSELGAYAPIAGLPDYLSAVQEACFRGHKPNAFTEAVATPGGTGAIKHAVWNYTEMGDEVLIADWYWAPYKTIAEEHGRRIRTFNYFKGDGMNVEAFKGAASELIAAQERVLIILNTPAHNPTGYSISEGEWEEIMGFLREQAKDAAKKIILMVDVAYIDFAGSIEASRDFFKHFGDLPQNLLVLTAFSLSKGYTMYGMRGGAIICLAATQALALEFKDVCSYSNRAAWSNGTRAAMRILADVYKDPVLFQKVEAEREVFKDLLNARNKAFMEEAEKVGLQVCPFRDGFFITIPCKDPAAVSNALKKENLFAVPLQGGLRFAPCAVSEEKCRIAPAMIKKYV